jgi:hypothetical protein
MIQMGHGELCSDHYGTFYRKCLSSAQYVLCVLRFFMAQQPLVGQGLLIIEASRSHTDTPHSVGLSGRMINPTHRPLPDNTEHSQETDIHDSGGI